MKKISKKLLSVLLSVLMITASLPFASVSVFADDVVDNLDAATANFETYITGLADNGINALYSGMGDAYKIYTEALYLRTYGTREEMTDVTNRLNTAVAGMKKFEQAKIDAAYEATHPVKIGNGVNQPLKGSEKTSAMGYDASDRTINDYDNVIYSDGENANWSKALDTEFIYKYGYPAVDTYHNRVRIYYPNAVILYDGITVPKVPIISAFQGYGKYSDNSALTSDDYRTVVMENLYESTNDVELLYNYWFGTTCGNPFDSNKDYLYENPEWPETDLSKLHSSDSHYYFSSDPSETAVNVAEANSKKHLTDSTNKYQIFKNSLQYIPTVSESRNFNAGYQEVKSTKWSGASQAYFRFLGNLFVWNNVNSMKVKVQDETAIYIVNYKYFLDSLNDALTEFQADLTVQNARDGKLGTILDAFSHAAEFNPLDEAKYPYSSSTFRYTDVKGLESTGMEAATRKCGDDIDEAVDILGQAELDDVDVQYENLLVSISAYEEKMSKQTVYTNMAEAYETYCTAMMYADSYQYGGKRDFEPTLQVIAYNLEKQTNAMRAVGKNAYNAAPGQGFDGDMDSESKTAAYKAAYNNFVYASSAPARTRESGFPTTTISPNTSFTRKTDNTSVTDGVLGLYRYCNTGTLTATDYDTGSSTYLYVPNVVGVYDGVSGDLNVPVLLGVRAAGGWTGLFTNPYHYTLWSYSSETEALPFAYPYWKTRKYVAGDSDKYDMTSDGDDSDKMGIRTNAYPSNGVTYIETANLNQILNGSTIAQSPNAISTNKDTAISTLYSQGYYSNTRSDNKSEAPNPENFYFNAIKLTKPNFTGTDWKKYMHEYTSITTMMRSNSTRGGSPSVSTDTSTKADTKYGSYSGTIDSLSMWVIDYSGVQAIIDANSGILTDEPMEIRSYSEGKLTDFFKDMDKLTACSPVNAKYEYENDKYTNTVPGSTLTGFSAATEQCAYDIWKLLDAGTEEEKVQVLDETGDYVSEENIEENLINKVNYVKNSDGDYVGTYDALRDAINAYDPEEIGPCAGDGEGDQKYRTEYEAALAQGQEAMSSITDIHDVDSGSYVDYAGIRNYEDPEQNAADKAAIDAIAAKIAETYEAFATHAAENQTRHGYVYSDGEDYFDNETHTLSNDFHCGLVPEHSQHLDENGKSYKTAEMELYENLAIAYDTLDPHKYQNNTIVLDGKEAFDEAIRTDLSEEEIIARQGMKAQDIVDKSVFDLMEALNINNGDAVDEYGDQTDKRLERYNFKFIVVNTETKEEVDATPFVIDENDESVTVDDQGNYRVPFGYLVNVTPRLSADAEPVDCTGWEVTSGTAASRRLETTTNNLPFYVLENTTIKAYYTPAPADSERLLEIKSVFGYELYKVNVPNGATVEIKANDLNTVIVNGVSYTVPNGLQQTITGWKYDQVEYYPQADETLLSFTVTKNTFLRPIAPVQPVNGPWVIQLDNQPIETTTEEPDGKSFAYDDIVTVTSNVEDCYAIAVNVNGQFIPVAYGNTFKFYANSGMTNFYSVVRGNNEGAENADGQPLYQYYVLGEDITTTYSDEQIFMMRANMPMAQSIAECTDADNSKFTTRSQFSFNIGNPQFNNGLKVTEVGTIYYIDYDGNTGSDAIAEGLILDNVGNDDFKVVKRRSSVLDLGTKNFSNQYSLTLSNPNNRKVYTRAYVKYEYSFNNMKPGEANQSSVISAVYYGNICEAFE